MNLAVRRFFLFFFSVAAFSACQEPTDIGLELQDENLIGTSYTDTLTIETGTVLLPDSIVSYRRPPVVGQYADPALGTVSATTFTEVGIAGNNLSFGTDVVVDSMVMTLEYAGLYGTTDNRLTLSVHQLAQGFDDRTSYFTNSQLPYNETALGTTTFVPGLVKKKNSTADSTVAQNKVRVRLDNAFASQIVSQAPYASQESFVNQINGLAIVPQGEPSRLLFLNYAADTSKITLYYKQNGSTEQLRYAFKFNFADISYFNRVTADRTGTAIAALQEKRDYLPAAGTGDESFVQAATQLYTKIRIPHLAKLREQQGNIIINRAELILPIKNASRTDYLSAPPQMVLYRTNNNNQILKNVGGVSLTVQANRYTSQAGTGSPAVASIPSGKDYYTVNITSYIQAAILGTVPNNELLMSAASVSTGSDNSTTVSTEPVPYRTIISNTPARPVKLVLYYSNVH